MLFYAVLVLDVNILTVFSITYAICFHMITCSIFSCCVIIPVCFVRSILLLYFILTTLLLYLLWCFILVLCGFRII